MIRYFYTLQNDPHGKSGYHLPRYAVIIILLTLFPVLRLPPHD